MPSATEMRATSPLHGAPAGGWRLRVPQPDYAARLDSFLTAKVEGVGDLLDLAVSTAKQAMMDRDPETGCVTGPGVTAAKYIMDRAWGKPTERKEVHKSSISLIARLGEVVVPAACKPPVEFASDNSDRAASTPAALPAGQVDLPKDGNRRPQRPRRK